MHSLIDSMKEKPYLPQTMVVRLQGSVIEKSLLL